jgi:hypothetical protein
MGFDLSNYATVEERIRQFWILWPEGRIETELIHHSDKSFIVKASAYKNVNDQFPSATDYAQETIGTSMTNKNFGLETCSTSAIGRCLATMNISTRKNEPRPSRQEMEKVVAYEDKPLNVTGGPMARAKATEKQIGFAISMLKEIAQRLEFSFEDVMKWACEEYKCATLQDFSMKQISHFIADLQKTKQQGESSVFYDLVRAKKGTDYDPWETPSN